MAGDLYNDTLKIKDAIEDTITWITEDDDGEAKRYTGVDLVSEIVLVMLYTVVNTMSQNIPHLTENYHDPFLNIASVKVMFNQKIR